ncbi:Domain of unknown function (DUF4833), putative [Angomonas deanei]|uniref:Uncharacterized protein n=1 Tax=Angomonas deanei TaxID=59799 RepID=A0A7G2CMB4_9TRYP|nr:Domain of unknown function (DUF4833), putative [Angomonas deanei]
MLAQLFQQVWSDPQAPYHTVETFNQHVRQLLPERGKRFRHDDLDTVMVIERSKNLNVVAYTCTYKEELEEKDENGKPVKKEVAKDGMIIKPDSILEKPKHVKRTVNPKNAVHAFWIKLEPEHVERRRGRGELHDHNELNAIEKKLAYGCSVTLFPSNSNGSNKSLWSEFQKQWNQLAKDIEKENKNNKNNNKENPYKRSLTSDDEKCVLEWHEVFQLSLAKFAAMPPVLLLHLPPLPPTENNENNEKNENHQKNKNPDDVTLPVMLTVIDGKVSILTKVFVASIEPKHFYQLPSVEYIEAFGVCLVTGAETYEKKTNK